MAPLWFIGLFMVTLTLGAVALFLGGELQNATYRNPPKWIGEWDAYYGGIPSSILHEIADQGELHELVAWHTGEKKNPTSVGISARFTHDFNIKYVCQLEPKLKKPWIVCCVQEEDERMKGYGATLQEAADAYQIKLDLVASVDNGDL